jgi:hypothetical protein
VVVEVVLVLVADAAARPVHLLQQARHRKVDRSPLRRGSLFWSSKARL